MCEWAQCKPHGNPRGMDHQDRGLPDPLAHELVIPSKVGHPFGVDQGGLVPPYQSVKNYHHQQPKQT